MERRLNCLQIKIDMKEMEDDGTKTPLPRDKTNMKDMEGDGTSIQLL